MQDCPASQPSRPLWLANLPFRRKLALIVGIPSAVALIGSLLTLSRAASNYQRARVLEQANSSSSFLIQAAAAQAKERGFASAALSDPGATNTRRAIIDFRGAGDAQLETALRAAQIALRGNRILAAARARLLAARTLRDRKRREVDAALALGKPASQALVQDWFDTQTRLILAERVFGSTLFLAQNPYELVIQYNGFIKANVFVASEFAGRERALLGRFIALGQPIAPEKLEELQRWRGVVEENLASIAQLRANPAMSPSVLQSIDQMESAFLGEYQQARGAVYLASAHGEPYPLTTDQWIAVSTRGINSILAVSERIGEEAARISRDQAAFSLANVLFILGMVCLLLLAIIASVFVARHLTLRLEQLRAGAERVARGDYSQPVAEANAPGRAGDEFAGLATVFNTMQDRVDADVNRRTRELSEANARLVTLNAEKDKFLGICSHDLKNPLSGVIGLADLIQADATEPEQVRAHAADILASAEFMFQLVANLLDLGAIEQGKINLTVEPVDLQALATRATEAYRRPAAAKNIQLNLTLSPEPVLVQADARAVTQIADNLISNAVKFTPPGGSVQVTMEIAPAVRREGLPVAPGVARLSVRDTGPGLSSADQGRLFEKYSRLSPRTTAGEHSTGLGLSIVKQLAEAMGGSVRCESELGHGSTFTLELAV